MLEQSHYTVRYDAHMHLSVFAVLDGEGKLVQRTRVDHHPGAIRSFLERLPEGTAVAL